MTVKSKPVIFTSEEKYTPYMPEFLPGYLYPKDMQVKQRRKPSIFASEEETARWYHETYGSYAPLMRGGDTFFRTVFFLYGLLGLLIVSSCAFSIHDGDGQPAAVAQQHQTVARSRSATGTWIVPKEVCGDYRGRYGNSGVCK